MHPISPELKALYITNVQNNKPKSQTKSKEALVNHLNESTIRQLLMTHIKVTVVGRGKGHEENIIVYTS